MRVLHLTLKRVWFEAIASGEKNQEYREWKPYWAKRLLNNAMADVCATYSGDESRWKTFDKIVFKNGYASDAPTMEVVCMGLTLGKGNPKWGGTEKCIIIQLGKILSIKNYNP